MSAVRLVSAMIALLATVQQSNADVFKDWIVGFGQGWLEHTTRNGPGNTFTISCDIGGNGYGAKIFVEIEGRDPPPNSMGRVFIDGDEAQITFDEYSNGVTDCSACAANFVYIWQKARLGQQMIVLFEDGRASKFSLKGASKALSKEPCTPG